MTSTGYYPFIDGEVPVVFKVRRVELKAEIFPNCIICQGPEAPVQLRRRENESVHTLVYN